MKKVLFFIYLALNLCLLNGCITSTPAQHLAQLATPCTPAHAPGEDSGFGGTGNTAECGFGGTGVIGTITDFGSIWVNGLEIELSQNLQIDTNLGHATALAIGQQVITTVNDPERPETAHVKVFYPVAGQVQQQSDRSLKIAGQTIYMDEHTLGLKKVSPGQFVAISAVPQADGSWLATRIDPNPSRTIKVETPSLKMLKARQALLEGTVVHKDHQAYLAPYNLPLPNDAPAGQLAIVQAVKTRRWMVESFQPLQHWRTDWRNLQQPLHINRTRLEMPHHEETGLDNVKGEMGHRDALKSLKDDQETLKNLHEEHEALESLQEMNENHKDIQDLQEFKQEIKAQKQQMEMLKEQMEQQRDAREHYYDDD